MLPIVGMSIIADKFVILHEVHLGFKWSVKIIHNDHCTSSYKGEYRWLTHFVQCGEQTGMQWSRMKITSVLSFCVAYH